MTTKAGVGWSINRNSKSAGREAALNALEESGIDTPDFVFMFSTIGYIQQEILDSVRHETSSAPLCGCSGEGVLTKDFVNESNFAIVVIVIKSDDIKFHNGISKNLSNDPVGVGQSLSENINKEIDNESVGLFMFPDFNLNFDRLLTSFQSNLKIERFFPIWGAVASDNFKFKKSYQYFNDQVVSDGIAWSMISGKVEVKSAVIHGCLPIGAEHTITSCEGNVIHEIDGRRADEVIADYITTESLSNWDKSHTLAELYPGFISNSKDNSEDERIIIRAILGGRDSKTGSIIIPSEFTVGTKFVIMRRDPSEIMESFNSIIKSLKSEIRDKEPKIIFHFECAGRGKIILRDTDRLDAIKNLQNSFPSEIPWIGFYCLGEIAPVNDKNYFHNSTTVIAAIL